MWWLVLLLAGTGPTLAEAEPWLGEYAAGPERIGFRWEGSLLYDHGGIAVPADGQWHETVPEFVVRHRVTWVKERQVFVLEETHDRSQPWRYELRLDRETGRLSKVSVQGEENVVRTYVRRKP